MDTRPIFVATDFGELSDEAIRQADGWAGRAGAPLFVCHVVPDLVRVHPLMPQLAIQDALAIPRLHERLQEAVSDRVEEITGRRPGDYFVDVEEGSAAAGILRRAEQCGARLIVVGATGKDPIERALLGSTAEQVVRHAHGPVLVARPSKGTGPVLAATDLTEGATAVVQAAVAEARSRQLPVSAIHSLDVGHPAMAAIEPSVVLPAAALAALRHACRETLAATLARFGAPEGTPVVADGPPAVSIPRIAAELRADLLVVGTHGRSGVSGVLLGSVAQAILRRAPCSVLVARVAS